MRESETFAFQQPPMRIGQEDLAYHIGGVRIGAGGDRGRALLYELVEVLLVLAVGG